MYCRKTMNPVNTYSNDNTIIVDIVIIIFVEAFTRQEN